MGVGEVPARLRGLRIRVTVHDYEGHPRIPPGTVVNVLGDPSRPDFLVIELDSAIEVKSPSGVGTVPIRHLAVSHLEDDDWDWGLLARPTANEEPARVELPKSPDEAVPFAPHFVKVWHVFDPRVATSQEWTTEAMIYRARGGLTKNLADVRERT